MGKSRQKRLAKSHKELSLPIDNEKYTLTKKQLSDLITRVRITQLHECGYNRSEIKKELPSSFDTIDRWKLTGFGDPTAFIEANRTGRNELSTQVEKVVLRKRKNKNFSTRTVAVELGISHTSVQNILNDAEAHWKVRPRATKLSETHKKARLKFCKKNQNQELSWWDKILVTDSKIFTLTGGRNPKHHGRWVFDDEELDSYEVEKYSSGLHVYGGVTSKGLTDLIFIKGAVTGDRYVSEVLPTLLSVQTRVNKTDDITTTKLFEDNEDWIFEQDHATSHDSNIAQEYLTQNVPNFFQKDDAPSKLDDLWCIERIWAVMTYKVYGQGQDQPKTLAELKKRIIKAWKSMETKMLRKAVHQMPLRMKQIVKNKGGRITQFKESCQCELCKE